MFFRKKPNFDEQLKQLQADLTYFIRPIGGWPPRIANASELQDIKKRWHKAFDMAQSLLKQRPDSLETKYVLAELLRMGHNIDVANAAQASQTLFLEIIKANPNHYKAYLSLASLYISVDVQAAPRAEQLFLKAKDLAAPKVIPDIYQGLGFTCLYQNKTSDAITYFQKYLQLQPNPDIQKLLGEITSDKKLTLVNKNLPNK
jgi:tetratricopeptide (TPR) repeat protein